MYLRICDPEKTYYSLKNRDNVNYPAMGLTFSGTEAECSNYCGHSVYCIGYLSDHNNICYIFQDGDIKNGTDIQHICQYPVKHFYGDLKNTDAWRWGKWKTDYPFALKTFRGMDEGFWDMCSGNPTYWNFTNANKQVGSPVIVRTPQECNQQCTDRGDGCVGWRFEITDAVDDLNSCYLYDKQAKPLKKGDYDYTCKEQDNISEFRLGTWKAKAVPPEYIRNGSI